MQERKSITALARALRKKPTPSEKKLWELLRHRQLGGCKFLRQRPMIYAENSREGKQFFIADFYCSEEKLVIELDGGIHRHNVYYDQQRDHVIEGLGLRVLRLTNEELEDMEKVRKKILAALRG